MLIRPISNTLRTLCVLGLLLLVAAPGAFSQARTITFDEAIQIALDRNVDLRRASNATDFQAAQVTEARGNFLPNLSVNMTPTQRYGLQFDQTAGALVQESTTALSASLGAQVNLFRGFGDVANYRRAQAELEATDYRRTRTRQAVIFDVISRYLELVQNRELIAIREENLEAERRQLARIEEFTRVGARPISELYQQQANVASAEFELLNAERSYQLSATRLIQILELDPFGEYRFEAPTVDEVTLQERQYQLGDLMQRAFESRVDLRAQRSQIDASEEGVRVARAGMWPTVNLNTSVGSSYSSRLAHRGFEEQLFQDNRTGFLGLSVSIPLFDRFQTKARIDQAQIQVENARLDMQSLQQNVALEVRQAFLDYQTAAKQVEVAVAQLRASDMALQAEQERYNVGASTLVELSQARAAYVRAASDHTSAVYNFLVQQKLIEYYLGEIESTDGLFN